MRSVDTVRFRPNQTIWLAALVAFFSALPIASVSWYVAPILLVPLAIAVWGWRSGTAADRSGLRLRALFGQHRIPWSEVAELGADPRGRVLATLTDGRVIGLPGVRGSDLPRLVAASGQPLDAATAASAGEPPQ
ncbi:PH domain-containing protein [Plantactinospora sp. KBS50]|uniref:PH domain-containing protein n=1 Tax=Plantactinospora sp. KBS50 TaxID=2024580 RepID=UPI000BAAD1FC|nr:PH domain-containing protein [Plantactinospora sp. KBS50]ASW53934.1 chemotaxis protein CheW [Plantactinospora sp. KBS50]